MLIMAVLYSYKYTSAGWQQSDKSSISFFISSMMFFVFRLSRFSIGNSNSIIDITDLTKSSAIVLPSSLTNSTTGNRSKYKTTLGKSPFVTRRSFAKHRRSRISV